MSSTRVKTEYQIEGPYGSIETKTLIAVQNSSCDIVTFFDEDGEYIFSVEDTVENNLLDAINRLYMPYKVNGELADGVKPLDREDLFTIRKLKR